MATRVTPFLMFTGEANQAIELYISTLPNSSIEFVKLYGAGGPGPEGTVEQAAICIAGQRVMIIDSPISHDFDFTPSSSLFVDCSSREELERLFATLSEGGTVMMPLDNYGFSERFGFCADRFGVSWQLNLPSGGAQVLSARQPVSALELTTPTPTSIQIVRSFDAPRDFIWRAHTEPKLVKQWMSGPPGHSLPVCEIDLRIGGKGRYVWKSAEFQMGMTAEFQEVVANERIVQTEVFDEWEDNPSTVTTAFEDRAGRTTITVVIEYGNQEARDAVLQPAFSEGYEASFVNLDRMARARVDD